MKIHYLVKKIAWFGKYSGYECLPNYMPQTEQIEFFIAKPKFLHKVLGKVYQYLNGWKNKRPMQIWSDMVFIRKKKHSDISHILYLEYHNNLLEKIKPSDKKLVATIHLPISFWKEEQLLLLPQLSNYIILYEEEVKAFKKYAPQSRFHVIKHGVDIDFFAPLNQPQIKRNKVVFIGHYLRNFEMFYHVYQGINAALEEKIEFHIIIPSLYRGSEWLQKIAGNDHVFFHEKLTDEELLAHYQDSNVMLMPVNDSGANTAIVQALSVGLPVITTDVGGIRSYGGGDVFPVIANNDWQAMTELFVKYYNDPQYREQVSIDQRAFSVKELDWNVIARQHLDVYKKIQA